MRKFTWLLALAVPVTIISCQKDAVRESSEEAALQSLTYTGNGAPKEAKIYQMNIIGTSDKNVNMTGGEGKRIFVDLKGTTNIWLSPGEFDILDANGTDGDASFQLPNPDYNNTGTTEYSVYARALGTPGGNSTTTTCATDPVTGETVCSEYSMVLVREKGKSSFTNVSKQLLYIYADLDGTGGVERYNLFNDRLVDYFWKYENDKLRVAQIRFYDHPTTVPAQ